MFCKWHSILFELLMWYVSVLKFSHVPTEYIAINTLTPCASDYIAIYI